MKKQEEMDDKLYQQMMALCEAGNKAVETDCFDVAIHEF
jgi:tetratricopeptide (TPR) repeat protein